MKLLNWSDKLTFGKYKGETIESVSTRDPQYLIWANDNVNAFNLDFQVLQVVEELVKGQQTERGMQLHDSAYDDDDEFDDEFDDERSSMDWGDFQT